MPKSRQQEVAIKEIPWQGLIAGAAAGVAASFVMNVFQSAWMRKKRGFSRGHGAQSAKTEPATKHGDDPTTKVAEAVAMQPLDGETKEQAGKAVHYAYGAAMGAAYGALAEVTPAATTGFGTAMGATVWLASDYALLPALRLSRPPQEYPRWVHVYSLTSHLIYGASAEMVRRLLLGPPCKSAKRGS
jgi:putative membrane protein